MRDKFELLPNIPVSNIQLDTSNFRIGTAANQRECIGLMFVDKRAEHIISGSSGFSVGSPCQELAG